MSYKFQVGSAALSGAVLHRLGTGNDSQFVLQNDAGSTKAKFTAAGELSGASLSIGHGDVKLNVSEGTIALGNDSLYFYDSDATMHRVSASAYATALAGDGLAASSGVLAVGVDDSSIELNSDALRVKASGIATAMIADNAVTLAKMAGLTRGSLILGDSSGDPSALAKGTAAQFLQSDGTDPSYVSISGDATVAAGGALTIANDAVESGMLNDNVISGQTELSADALVAADEMMISDGGVLKKIGVDNLFLDGPGLLAAAAIDVSADHFMFLDGGATGDAKIESIVDLASGMAGAGLAASGGVLAVQGNSVTAIADGSILTEGYNVATGSNGTSVYLPANVSVGDVFTVKAAALGSSQTINISPRDSDGQTIDGETSVTIMSQYGAVTMVYAVSGSWIIV